MKSSNDKCKLQHEQSRKAVAITNANIVLEFTVERYKKHHG